jgi:hypothetical protein
MNQSIKRSIFRWIHIVFSIPILGYIYSPLEQIPTDFEKPGLTRCGAERS